MADPEAPIKTLETKVVYQNPWITIHEDKTQLPSGGEGLYGYMHSRDSVMTAILSDDNQIFMVRAFRYPTKSWGWELAGGGADEGEEPAAAALREVEEETGIKVLHHEQIGRALVCNGLMTERTNIFVGYGVSRDGHQEIGDEGLADMRFFTLDEIDDLIDSGEINDGQTITGLFYLQRWLEKNGRI